METLQTQQTSDSQSSAGKASPSDSRSLGKSMDVDLDIEAELKKFEREQMAELGLEPAAASTGVDDNPCEFTGDRARPHDPPDLRA